MIQDVIQAVALELPVTSYGPWNYLFGDAAVLNIRADHEAFPIVALSHRIFGTPQKLPTGRRFVTYNVQMYFLARTDFKHRKDDEIDVAASQAMEIAMRQFEILLSKSQWVDHSQPNPVQMGRFELLYNELDANCDGVVVLFDIRLSDAGFNYCFAFPVTTVPVTTLPPPTTLVPTTFLQTTAPNTTAPPTTAPDPGIGDMTIPDTFIIH